MNTDHLIHFLTQASHFSSRMQAERNQLFTAHTVKEAAVLVGIVLYEGMWQILLTKRAETFKAAHRTNCLCRRPQRCPRRQPNGNGVKRSLWRNRHSDYRMANFYAATLLWHTYRLSCYACSGNLRPARQPQSQSRWSSRNFFIYLWILP